MIKTLAKSLRSYTKESVITATMSIIEVIFEIIIPLYMSDLIDFGINAGSTEKVWEFGILLLIFAVMELAAGVLAAKFAAKAAAGFSANLREDMYNNVQTFSFSNIDKFSSASIVTRLTTDVTNIQNAWQMMLRMAIRGPIMMIFAMIVSFTISQSISLIFLAIIPILAILLYLIMHNVGPYFRRVFHTYDELNSYVEEDVKGIRVVKSANREAYEIKQFGGISQRIYKDFSAGEKILAFNSPLMQFCLYVVMIMISWIGAKAIIASGNNAALGLTTGQLTALLSYAQQILTSLMMLSMVFTMITLSASSGNRIAEILNEKADITSPENAVKTVKDGSIKFEHVNFVYSARADKRVLTDINLDIYSGETVGIIGGTGSSKSSLVQLIPRLYDTEDGTVSVGGVDVRKYDLEELRESVAMVLQKNELFSGTIADNLRWGNPDATDEQLVHACKLACADEFITTLPDGYNTHIEQGGTNVSGGQKQRLCIARALLKSPKVLILDDSTSAVDTKTDAKIRHAFANSIPDTTKIIIAQRISSVQDADRILVMDDGKIVDQGTHDELLGRCKIYQEVYQSQQKGDANNE